MRYILLAFIAIACSTSASKNEMNYASYGQEIESENPISVESLLSAVDTVSRPYQVKGVIEEVCQMKGCWMTLRNASGENVRVTFLDYGFFVPKDISGSEVIIEGMAFKETLEEDVARHYADDSGKAYEESMRNSISFVAHGVMVAYSEES